MTRLFIVCEGQSERVFVEKTLAPYLLQRRIYGVPIVVATSRERNGRKREGGGDWLKWRADLEKLRRENVGEDVRFTTMFDLHRLPKNFPGFDEAMKEPNTRARAVKLEQAMAESVQDKRLIPYLQRHEFEALVFADLDSLASTLAEPDDLDGLRSLRLSVGALDPEEINDGAMTAPSTRLIASIPSYRKTEHGPRALQTAGLVKIRSRCPRFDAWLTKLEALGRSEP